MFFGKLILIFKMFQLRESTFVKSWYAFIGKSNKILLSGADGSDRVATFVKYITDLESR